MEPSELAVVLEEGGTWSDGGVFFPEKDAPHLGDLETQADLSQDPEGPGGQEGEVAQSGEVVESGERRPRTPTTMRGTQTQMT